MRRLILTLLACTALAIAGCGGDDESSSSSDTGSASTPAATSGGNAVSVSMKDIQFVPKDVTVKAGGTVTWTNEDSVDHDAVAKSGDVPKSELFGKGKTYEATFDTPGKIDYVCTVHPGMEGTITVE
jgi:plastocyanin